METVIDLTQTAGTVDDAISWLVRASGRRLTTPARLKAGLEARQRLRWREALITAVADVGAGCQSTLELRYLRDVEHGLPAGTRQRRRKTGAATVYRDVEYDEFALIVELDGQAAHLDPTRDRPRDNAAATLGWSTLRFGWADVNARPCETAMVVSASLRRSGWTGAARRCARLPDPMTTRRIVGALEPVAVCCGGWGGCGRGAGQRVALSRPFARLVVVMLVWVRVWRRRRLWARAARWSSALAAVQAAAGEAA